MFVYSSWLAVALGISTQRHVAEQQQQQQQQYDKYTFKCFKMLIQ